MLALDPLLAAGDEFVPGGGYISILKVIPPLIVLMIWARLLTWTDKDAQAAHLPRLQLNFGNVCGMGVGFALFFLLPTFIVSFIALLGVMAVEAAIYLRMRNKEVGLGDLKKEFDGFIESLKGKNKNKNVMAAVGKITFMGKDGKPLPIPEPSTPDRPAYDILQEALTEPIQSNSRQIDIAPEGDSLIVKYMVDNFTHRGRTIDRVAGAAVIAYAKWATGLNVEDKRKPQTGTLKIAIETAKYELKVQTAGTTAGEFLRIVVNPKTRHSFKLDELGFSATQKKLVTDLLKTDKGGLVLLSTPRGHGLTSLLYTILKSHDAFLEHAQTIERDQEQDLEGITQNKLAPNAPAGEEAKQIDWVLSQEPDVLGVSKVEDPKSAALLLDAAKNGKRIYVCLRASSTFEALEQWKRIVGNTAAAVEPLKAVINGRVIRKLCLACKEGFTPDPATLKKLNFNPDDATTLYKAREQSLRDAKGQAVKCEFCHDLRFKGAVGVFETLTMDEEMRLTLDAGKPLNQAFRKQRGHYLQEEALVLVKQGDTSVQEVLRVLKPVPEGAATSAASSAAPARTVATAKTR